MKAGFGRSDITPRIGGELYGFGPFLNRRSIGIRDRLEARAAAFEAEGKKAVIVGCDLCLMHAPLVEAIRREIRCRRPELTAADILINCSHTHSAPSTVTGDMGGGLPEPVYMELLPAKIARAALIALDNLEESEAAFARAPCEHIGLNRVYDRDAPPLEEVLRDDWRPAMPELTDTEVRVLKFTAPEGRLQGFMACFGCHPVVCCQESRYVHGDFPGVAVNNLMRQLPGAVGVFLQGAVGDVNSCVVHKPEAESLLALDVIAGRFEFAIRRALAAAEPIAVDRLATATKTVDFTTRPTFGRDYLLEVERRQEAILRNPDADENDHEVRTAKVCLRGARMMLEALAESDRPVITQSLYGVRLGPVAFLGAPFEIMQAIKNDVVAGAAAPIPWVMSLTNGTAGYAPDRRQREASSFEATMVPFMHGRLPYADIHDELCGGLLEIDRILA